MLYIIDYKTGSGTSQIASLENLFETKKHKETKAIFQTLLYGLLINPEEDGAEGIKPGISWMKDLFKENYTTDVSIKPPKEDATQIVFDTVKDDFQKLLDSVVDEIFDPETDFYQTSHELSCVYCTFKNLCNR